MLACSACQRGNRAHRGFCGQCGVTLQPVCRGCRFVNEAHDKFCGGCGSALVVDARVAYAAVPDIGLPLPGSGVDEIRELFSPVTLVAADALPSTGITQSDLDQLFGMGA